MGKRSKQPEPETDSTAWLIDSSFAQLLLLHRHEIKLMAMFAYAFYHGSHLFDTFTPNSSIAYRFVSMILKCTGGGILVPVFLNTLPFPLAQDAYAIAVLSAFCVHNYLPVVREAYRESTIFQVAMITLYEAFRATVVVKLTAAGAASIPASEFSVPVFGPIFCGTIAGCGYMFLPLSQGLEPLKNGLGPSVFSSLVAATFYHAATVMLPSVQHVNKKMHVLIAIFFIAYNLSLTFSPRKGTKTAHAKTE